MGIPLDVSGAEWLLCIDLRTSNQTRKHFIVQKHDQIVKYVEYHLKYSEIGFTQSSLSRKGTYTVFRNIRRKIRQLQQLSEHTNNQKSYVNQTVNDAQVEKWAVHLSRVIFPVFYQQIYNKQIQYSRYVDEYIEYYHFCKYMKQVIWGFTRYLLLCRTKTSSSSN